MHQRISAIVALVFVLGFVGFLVIRSPKLDIPPVPSGGLGLTQREWEAIHGQYWRSEPSGSFQYTYDDAPLTVSYFGDAISKIEQVYVTPITLDKARTRALQFLPKDAVEGPGKPLTGSIRNPQSGMVDFFQSDFLPTRVFPTVARRGDVWQGHPDGTITITYFMDESDAVTGLVISVGEPHS